MMRFDFVGKRKIFYAISIIFILISISSFFAQGFNLGIDFKGGTLISFKFEQTDIQMEQVREVLSENELGNSSIQKGTDDSFTIKTVELSQERQLRLLKGFEERIGKFDLLRTENVGPVIGSELQRNAIIALAIASVLQVIYISFRFEFKFGIAAIIALLHDVIIAIGFFSLFQYEVDGTFVAAILTIIGYSINDTIVIFDRIRENMKNRRKEDLATIINNSLSQTLIRTINTGMAVIFMLIVLLIFGGETTKYFSIAMLVGVFSGLYSSIGVAAQLWYDFKPEGHKKVKTA